MPFCGRASPSMAVSIPALILSSVDLPDPFRPSTPILAPGKNERLMSRRIVRLGGTTLDTRFIVKMYWAIRRAIIHESLSLKRASMAGRLKVGPEALGAGRPGACFGANH